MFAAACCPVGNSRQKHGPGGRTESQSEPPQGCHAGGEIASSVYCASMNAASRPLAQAAGGRAPWSLFRPYQSKLLMAFAAIVAAFGAS